MTWKELQTQVIIICGFVTTRVTFHIMRTNLIGCRHKNIDESSFKMMMWITVNCGHLVLGGLISFDIFPEGWDKRLCLELLDREGLDAIYFFGNETSDVSAAACWNVLGNVVMKSGCSAMIEPMICTVYKSPEVGTDTGTDLQSNIPLKTTHRNLLL